VPLTLITLPIDMV